MDLAKALLLITIETIFMVVTARTVRYPGRGVAVESNITGTPHYRIIREISETTTGFDFEEQTKMLQKHNELRRLQKSSNMLMMEWDNDLQDLAQRKAEGCDFAHSPSSYRTNVGAHKNVGENLAVYNYKYPLVDPVQAWYDEISDYDYNTNRANKPNAVIGHYTQLVWAHSFALGCGVKYCNNLKNAPRIPKGYNVVCHYGPAGNYRGVRPFKKGSACSDCGSKTPFCVRGLCARRPQIGGKANKVGHNIQTAVIFDTGLAAISVWISAMLC
ncbi:cysteine-rich venom protein [Plakobranchus ocellatus]|uniref:Cysteine-rich venom protein n=1 Tax=Plakobranchus ocellatus TaxID=259542 RepID=A0AAV3ZQA6_9GAST|nr:cysteine-rich venom protein [Plakobranchus ocellatus]